MVIRDETEIEYVDKTLPVRSDTFVNEDYKGATISNIGRFLELESLHQKDGTFRRRAEERLGFKK